jgi:hypothetical protein
MSEPKVTRRKLSDYQPNPNNHNLGSERGLQMIEASFNQYGAGRSLLADKNGVLIAGNQSQAGALEAGFEDVIEVETDGKSVVVVKRRDLDLSTDKQAVALSYMDNRAHEVSFQLDPIALQADAQAGVDFSAMFTTKELNHRLEQAGGFAFEGDLNAGDVPDALWPTDNQYGIPLLDINYQADALDLPVSIWGATKRAARMRGTWLFYTEDYRYEALWTDPTSVINSVCVNAAEPNYSCYSQMPFAVGLWAIYRKRWLARYWQSRGIRILVDLNVHERFADVNLMGVPQGWKAYATRGYSERLDSTDAEYARARERAGTSSILFVVYGGGKAVEAHCQQRGWIWINEEMQRFANDGKE